VMQSRYLCTTEGGRGAFGELDSCSVVALREKIIMWTVKETFPKAFISVGRHERNVRSRCDESSRGHKVLSNSSSFRTQETKQRRISIIKKRQHGVCCGMLQPNAGYIF
jgi:hypothetical protein